MYQAFHTTVLLVATFAAGSVVAKTAAKKRDLGAGFATAVCDGTLGDQPFKAWSLAVYDAQVEGRRVSPLGGLTLKPDLIERKAKTLARLGGLGGYASGLCKDGTGWAVAMPASRPLTADKNGRIKLPLAELAEACESYRVDFAPADQGPPKALAITASTIATATLGDGVIGVTCQPKTPRWRGPTLWYLFPTQKGPRPVVPEAEVFAAAPAMPVAGLLASWVNRVRLKEGLKALEFKSELTEQAELLAVDGSLSHDRLMLKKTATRLQDSARLHLLGEDRVKGRTAEAMAWLWWNSPRHRSLILNTEATAGGIASRGIGDEQLAVLAVASSTPQPSAKAKTRKAKATRR